MTTCQHCNREFPDHLIAPFYHNGTTTAACPLCAFEFCKKTHGEQWTGFHGRIASGMYEEAIEYVKAVKHVPHNS